MNLRLRVVAAVALLVALTVLGAWMVAGNAVLRPLVDALGMERADTAVFAAREIKQTEPAQRRRRALELAKDLGIRMRVIDELPQPLGRARPRIIQRKGQTVYMARAPRAPVLVSLGDDGGAPYLAVHFAVDLDKPRRRVGLGLLLILGVAVVGAVGASRWMLSPLELASSAMKRVADGDLSHRVDVGADAAGRIGATFNRMADRVQGLVDGQRQLMAAVSHELRTPLTRMRLQTELLREQGADPLRLDALDADIAEVDGLVGELLESARLRQGVLALHLQDNKLADLVKSAVAGAGLGERPLTVSVPDHLVVNADSARLQRVLANLLSNIVRYTPPDAAVEITAHQADAEVFIEVADHGPGVPEAALAQLFDPFYRTEHSRSRTTGGLGLGLMLVRQVMEAHGGRVSAHHRQGGGLLVRCVLPARPA